MQEMLFEGIRTLAKDLTAEYRLRKADGTTRWVRSLGSAYSQPDGRIICFGTTSDITERKQMETTLRESKEFFGKIINSIGDPIFVIDRQHRHILVNDAMCELSNHTREEILGKKPYDFFPKEQVDVFVQNNEVVFETGMPLISCLS
jgi:PAS domain-containing protein